MSTDVRPNLAIDIEPGQDSLRLRVGRTQGGLGGDRPWVAVNPRTSQSTRGYATREEAVQARDAVNCLHPDADWDSFGLRVHRFSKTVVPREGYGGGPVHAELNVTHNHGCPATRFGKKHGPCDCGAQEMWDLFVTEHGDDPWGAVRGGNAG
jgi:hypothetical protein